MGHLFGSLIPLAPFIMVVAIVWITFHYKHKYPRDTARHDRHRRNRGEQTTTAPEPEPTATPVTPDQADLAEVAERMEQRIAALEQLLDAKSPGWRNRHD
ncbi:MAG: hypothetical protein IT494_00330 [Gammaproteobacteria bacterium]|nr:hypothetical protein [Gammaproteobacteria bacterium]